MDVSAGMFWLLLVIRNGKDPEDAPSGLRMATCAIPGVVNRLAGIAARSWAELMKFPGNVVWVPPGVVHAMEAPETMLAPLAASVKPLELVSVALGSSEESCGTTVMVTV